MSIFAGDIIIIGGGIVGNSIAFRLAENGQKVILLEKGRVGEERDGDQHILLVPALLLVHAEHGPDEQVLDHQRIGHGFLPLSLSTNNTKKSRKDTKALMTLRVLLILFESEHIVVDLCACLFRLRLVFTGGEVDPNPVR